MCPIAIGFVVIVGSAATLGIIHVVNNFFGSQVKIIKKQRYCDRGAHFHVYRKCRLSPIWTIVSSHYKRNEAEIEAKKLLMSNQEMSWIQY